MADVDQAADFVGLTTAEFIPRQVMHLKRILNGFPLLGVSRLKMFRAAATRFVKRA